jgi:DNA-binding MarR family transcriptional regulator
MTSRFIRSAARPKARRSSKARGGELALGQLDRHLGYFLRRLQLWVFQDFIETLKPMKVRPAQYSVLLVIEANPGRSQSAVGEVLGIERARLARILHDLERRRWIARHTNGDDARSHSLHLTADGEKALTRIKHLAGQHEEKLRNYVGTGRHKTLLDWLRRSA